MIWNNCEVTEQLCFEKIFGVKNSIKLKNRAF